MLFRCFFAYGNILVECYLDAFVCVFLLLEIFGWMLLRWFFLYFKCLEFSSWKKKIKTVLITSISILLKQSSRGRYSVKRKDVLKNFAKFTAKHLFRSHFLPKVAGWKPETFRSSHCRCSVKQGALKNFANYTGNNLCWSIFLIKLHIWCLQIYQRRLQYRCLPVKFAIILKNICECLLVNFI